MAAYKVAVSTGISPVEFWGLTPYLTRMAIVALSDERITQTWMLAGMMRTKKLPKLEKLLNKKSAPINVEAKLKGLFAAHNERTARER